MRVVDGYLAKYHWSPKQVQDFIPLAMTMGCAMYCAEMTPDGQPIRVNKGLAERRGQRDMLRRDRDAGSSSHDNQNEGKRPQKERKTGWDKHVGQHRNKPRRK